MLFSLRETQEQPIVRPTLTSCIQVLRRVSGFLWVWFELKIQPYLVFTFCSPFLQHIPSIVHFSSRPLYGLEFRKKFPPYRCYLNLMTFQLVELVWFWGQKKKLHLNNIILNCTFMIARQIWKSGASSVAILLMTSCARSLVFLPCVLSEAYIVWCNVWLSLACFESSYQTFGDAERCPVPGRADWITPDYLSCGKAWGWGAAASSGGKRAGFPSLPRD